MAGVPGSSNTTKSNRVTLQEIPRENTYLDAMAAAKEGDNPKVKENAAIDSRPLIITGFLPT